MKLTDIKNQMGLTDTQRIFNPKVKEYTFFSALQGTFSKTDRSSSCSSASILASILLLSYLLISLCPPKSQLCLPFSVQSLVCHYPKVIGQRKFYICYRAKCTFMSPNIFSSSRNRLQVSGLLARVHIGQPTVDLC